MRDGGLQFGIRVCACILRCLGIGNDRVQACLEFRDRPGIDVGALHAQGVVALGGNFPAFAIGRDQGAVEQAVQHLLACAAFDVLRKPVDPAVVGVDGLGQDGVLGGGEWEDGLLLLGWLITRPIHALNDHEAKQSYDIFCYYWSLHSVVWEN